MNWIRPADMVRDGERTCAGHCMLQKYTRESTLKVEGDRKGCEGSFFFLVYLKKKRTEWKERSQLQVFKSGRKKRGKGAKLFGGLVLEFFFFCFSSPTTPSSQGFSCGGLRLKVCCFPPWHPVSLSFFLVSNKCFLRVLCVD